MKMNVSEFAKVTGVSVRTLHYYDEIGLLKPDSVDEDNGYRFYGQKAMETMQQILFYRELDFSLKAIGEILSSPNYNKQGALESQRELLILKRQRLDRIIAAIDSAREGEEMMSFEAFGSSGIDAYKEEVKKRYGETEAYREHQEKTARYSGGKWDQVARELNDILAAFAQAKAAGVKPADGGTLELVKRLQTHITQTQYHCTDEILASLGEMYVADGRFRKNIDKNGAGTAEFISEAIKIYCKK